MGLNIKTASQTKTILQLALGVAVIFIGALAIAWYAVIASANPPGPATDESYFTFDSLTGTITDYDGINGPKDVVIPNQIGGVDVLAIADATYDGGTETYSGAFADKGLTSVYVGDTVANIGSYAFTGNPLTSVIIGTSAYSGAPKMVIEPGNFNGVNSETQPFEPPIYDHLITSVTLNSVIKEIHGSFNGSLASMSLALPESIELIDSSFHYNLITSLVMGDSNTNLETSFNANYRLQTVDIESVGSISDSLRDMVDVVSIEIGEVNGDLAGISANYGITYADTQGDLYVNIGKVNGDITSWAIAGFPNFKEITIQEVTGSLSSAAIAGGDWTIDDTASSLEIEIGKVGGDITNSSIYHLSQLTKLTIGEVVGSISSSSIYNNQNMSVSDTAGPLTIEIGSVGNTISDSIYGYSNLANVTINSVGNTISGSIYGNSSWTNSDVFGALSIQIDNVGSDIFSSINLLQGLTDLHIKYVNGDISSSIYENDNLSQLTIDEVTGSIENSIYNGLGVTIADTASSLSILLDTIGGSLYSSVYRLPHLTSLTVNHVGGDIDNSVYGGSGWTASDTANSLEIEIGNVVSDVSTSFYNFPNPVSISIDSVGGSIENASFYEIANLIFVEIGNVGGDIRNGTFYDIPTIEEVTILRLNGSIHSGAFSDMAALKTLTIGTSGDTAASTFSIGSGAFYGSNAIETLNFYGTVTSIADGSFLDKHIKVIRVGGNMPIMATAFGGNNANTGEYMRIYTTDPTNPHNFQDAYVADPGDINNPTLAYIVNPTVVNFQHLEGGSGDELASDSDKISSVDGINDYTMASNPVTDTISYQQAFSAYYRTGQVVSFAVPQIPGYSSPETISITLGASENNIVTFEYTAIVPGVPNTGAMIEALKANWHIVLAAIGVGLLVLVIGLRIRTKA